MSLMYDRLISKVSRPVSITQLNPKGAHIAYAVQGKDSTKIIHVPHSACRECAETGYEESASRRCLRNLQVRFKHKCEAAREIQGMLLHLRNAHTYN